MESPLQDFSFDRSEYERPTQQWVCGWAADGRPCRIGPDHKGSCRATFECKPLSKNGRWVCTRSPAAGGRCSDGPLPTGRCARRIPKCQPVRSLRGQRGMVVRSVSALTIGMTLLFVGPVLVDVRNTIISPGELSAGHAGIADCTACHAARAEASVARGRAARLGASRACVACHAIASEQALHAHGLDPDRLSEVSERVRDTRPNSRAPSVLLASIAPGAPKNERGQLACRTCHPEHRGRDWQIGDVSGQRCQTCHLAAFPSFANGHPEFGEYPQYPSADDSFDHDEPPDHEDDCTVCHLADDAGADILTRGYAETCADCHLDEMAGEYPSTDRRTTRAEPRDLLTRFDHGPHLTTACNDCHRLGSADDFAPIAKATCASCHTGGRVTQRCLTCHIYHSERFEMRHPSSQ